MELTVEEFDNLWELNPNGSYEITFNAVQSFLNTHPRTGRGDIIDFFAFFEMYKQHVEYLAPFQNAKYTKPDKEIATIQKFINDRMYLKVFRGPKKIRDAYLFGEMKKEYLQERVKAFRKKFRK